MNISGNFHSIIQNFKTKKILLIGDAMLDTYMFGTSSRICREAPVPIVEIKDQTNTGGGAANTAINLAELGAQVYFISAIGNDLEGKLIKDRLDKHAIPTGAVYIDTQRQTLSKTRILANGQLLVRCDSGSVDAVSSDIEDAMVKTLFNVYTAIDAVIISDYGYGIVTEQIMKTLEKLQKLMPRPLIIDSKYPDMYSFLRPTLVKPNYQEAVRLLGITKTEDTSRIEQIRQYRQDLFEKTGASIVSVTLDSEGAITFDTQGTSYRTYTDPVQNTKAAGAGDTYTTAFCLSLISKAPLPLAAEIAAAAARVTIKKEGTAFCTNAELIEAFYSESKIITSYGELSILLNKINKSKQRVVFTNGCFDLLHSGHVTYLNQAKKLGELLVVGVNSDTSVKRLKGKERPINPLADRMQVLAGLSSVDYVIPFEENTPINLIKLITPAIYVKGGDYTRERLPETPIVEGYGGKVEIIPFIPEKSTSNIIQKIRISNGGKHATL